MTDPIITPTNTLASLKAKSEGGVPGVGRKEDSVEVLIEGHKYVVRSDLEGEAVRQIAFHVDRIMKEIKRRSPNVSPTKVAILAALNIAEELFRLKENCSEVIERSAELTDLIDQMVTRHAGSL